jgi:hypothetical protein
MMWGLVLMAALTTLVVLVERVRSGRRDARRIQSFDDPLLGTLKFDPEVGAWRSSVTVPSGRIKFLIGGDIEPDARLRSHATEIASSADAFLRRIREYLEREAVRDVRWADHVRALALEEVCLYWPKRPDDGMLYFSGPDEDHRVWRCGYVEREPQRLGFDS